MAYVEDTGDPVFRLIHLITNPFNLTQWSKLFILHNNNILSLGFEAQGCDAGKRVGYSNQDIISLPKRNHGDGMYPAQRLTRHMQTD